MSEKEYERMEKEQPGEKAAKFPPEVLRQNCVALFQVTTSTYDGAVYGREGEFTVAQMKSIINEWKKKEVR